MTCQAGAGPLSLSSPPHPTHTHTHTHTHLSSVSLSLSLSSLSLSPPSLSPPSLSLLPISLSRCCLGACAGKQSWVIKSLREQLMMRCDDIELCVVRTKSWNLKSHLVWNHVWKDPFHKHNFVLNVNLSLTVYEDSILLLFNVTLILFRL